MAVVAMVVLVVAAVLSIGGGLATFVLILVSPVKAVGHHQWRWVTWKTFALSVFSLGGGLCLVYLGYNLKHRGESTGNLKIAAELVELAPTGSRHTPSFVMQYSPEKNDFVRTTPTSDSYSVFRGAMVTYYTTPDKNGRMQAVGKSVSDSDRVPTVVARQGVVVAALPLGTFVCAFYPTSDRTVVEWKAPFGKRLILCSPDGDMGEAFSAIAVRVGAAELIGDEQARSRFYGVVAAAMPERIDMEAGFDWGTADYEIANAYKALVSTPTK